MGINRIPALIWFNRINKEKKNVLENGEENGKKCVKTWKNAEWKMLN